MGRKRIVIVEDDKFLRQQIALLLNKEYEVIEAGDRLEGEKVLAREKPELALIDLHMPPSGKVQEGMKLLDAVKQSQLDTIVIVMSGDADRKATLRAVESGAYDFFRKPFDLDELQLIIRRALEKREIEKENERLKKELQSKYSFDKIIGQSPGMLRVFEAVKRVADTPATVIIRGESGTGKELIARAIHYNSQRAERPFVSVNCAALPETLVESELFGHERGAFTGAVSTHVGRFELAHGGTLFLDEIGSISSGVQAKMLRVLQERCFERIGGTKKIATDVRLITATNEDLEEKVKDGQFREDLYYRVNVFPINIPPIRERKDDIPLLLDNFMRQFCHQNKIPLKGFDTASLEALTNYAWKGNVRELENLVQTLVLMSDSQTIGIHELPSYIIGDHSGGKLLIASAASSNKDLETAVQEFERAMIESALSQTKGIKAQAAKLLGVDKNRMKYLCRKYGI